MAFEVASEPAAFGSAGSPDSVSSSSDIDRILSEILNDPNVFSLIDSPSSSSSSAPSPPCYSPSPQQLEQEALASLGQQQPPPYRVSTERETDSSNFHAPETPSPTTPSSSTDDTQAFFPSSTALSPVDPLPSSYPHPHPTFLSLRPTPPPPPPYHHHHHQLSPLQPLSPTPLTNVEVVVSPSFNDPFLRGKQGKVTALCQGIARVFVYSLNQECQVPVTSICLVMPSPGDHVQVIGGPLAGVSGLLYSRLDNTSQIQLCTGTCAQVATKNVAKVSAGGITPTTVGNPTPFPSPLPSPTSPCLVSSTCEPSLNSPASLQNGQYPSLTSPTSVPPNPPSFTTNGTFYPPSNSNHSNSSPYIQHCPTRQAQLPGYHATFNGARTTPLRLHNCAQMSELQRRRQVHVSQQLQALRARHGGCMPIAFNGKNHFLMQRAKSAGSRSLNSHPQMVMTKFLEHSTHELVEEVRARTMVEYDFTSTGDGGELSSNCIQVPLICPLSQRRMSLPCRGMQCKHPQCFDAEAYIEFNKCIMRPKEKKERCRAYQSIKQQLFKCPLCSKPLPFSQLYVDKTMLHIVQDTDEEVVEFDKTGSWKPVEKKTPDDDDVIDLTLEDDDS